jgi:hypothetical protein
MKTMKAEQSTRNFIGKRSSRGSLDPEKLFSQATELVSQLKEQPVMKVDSMHELKTNFSNICKVYYQLAACSRRKVLDEQIRKKIYNILFDFRSAIENSMLSNLRESEGNFNIEKEVLKGRFFGSSSKQGVSIRYALASCKPTKSCGGRCYAHDGRDRDLNSLVRGVLNHYYGAKFEISSLSYQNFMINQLLPNIFRAVTDAMKDHDEALNKGFKREPRIRFSHVGEMASTPNFCNRIAQEIKKINPDVQCVIYTRSPVATYLDEQLFVINFTVDDSSDSRLRYANNNMNIVNSAWDGKLLESAHVNFLEHHVETVSAPKESGSICAVTYNHKDIISCDEAKCDKCFK